MNGLTARWCRRGSEPGAAGAALTDWTGGAEAGGLVDRVLAARGLAGEDSAAFLDPRLTHLHDPSLMPDLDRAAARLLEALERNETIAIYGDYDVDGVTATAILYHIMQALQPRREGKVICYVPHRLEEGYGLNEEAIRELAGRGASVIVSVDCGVTAAGPALVARELGVDLIITDHHTIATMTGPGGVEREVLPSAYAVVHPRREGSAYPFGELAGAGVAYKLAWRICTLARGGERLDAGLRGLLVELLAFAALGTIADVAPLVGENRVIARYGLVRVRSTPLAGLRALVEASGLTGEAIDAMAVGFRLGPRLNAAGRMGHARDAVELFTTAGADRAAELAEKLSGLNDERRATERLIFEQACAQAEAAGMTGADQRAIVLADEGWHAGVVGIVCSRLVERYCRPAILMQRRAADGVCQGSGRSIDGFNLHAGVRACSEHLERFGGHGMAVGVHVRTERLEEFTRAFIAHASERIGDEMLRPRLEIDCAAGAGELTVEVVRGLDRLAPFGRENPEPRVLLRGMKIAEPPRLMGSGGKHCSLLVRDGRGGARGGMLRVVAWGWGERPETAALTAGRQVDLVVKPRVSTFLSRVSVEPELCDAAVG